MKPEMCHNQATGQCTDFPTETLEGGRQGPDVFKKLKESHCQGAVPQHGKRSLKGKAKGRISRQTKTEGICCQQMHIKAKIWGEGQ